MKRTLATIFLIVAIVPAYAEYKAGYYRAMDGKKREQLKVAAKQCVNAHTQLEYYELPNYWQYSDVYPELVNGLKRWWDMYSDQLYLIQRGMTGKASFSANRMQREHAVPKSWWKYNGSVEYTPAYSDMWNLYPSDGTANQAKLNYPLGLTATTTFDNGVTKVGPSMTGYGGGSAFVFEPADEYKGDFARAFFYMATVYDDLPWVYTYIFQQNSYPTLRSWAIDMLLEWSRRDKVSQKEIDRNNVVEQYQGNRNPFVDFPELAEYIWGSRTSEVFYIDQQNDTPLTPPITGDPEITAPVNNEALDFGEVAVGHSIERVLQIAGNNLTMPLSLRVSGTDKSFFVPAVTSIPAATMNQNQGYLLPISYTPASTGTHEARITLYDGGLPAGQSITVVLRGECLPVPQFSTLTAYQPIMQSDTEYTATWSEAPGVADYYLVTRIKYSDGNAEAETYETQELSYTFTNRDPGVQESYSVQYSRLNLLSPMSNTIVVNAGADVDEVPRGTPVVIYRVESGIITAVTGRQQNLRIYDAAGRIVTVRDEIVDGELIELPGGVYIITAPGLARPVKIVI